MKILVVDDEALARERLLRLLGKLQPDAQCLQAGGGEEALALVAEQAPDLLLLDIRMPEMDGLEVLEKIFEEEGDAQVIMISGHGNIDNAVEAIKKGAYDFIEKPLDLNRLLITIRNALDKSTLITETKVSLV